MERLTAKPTIDTVDTLVTVPTGVKFEVINVAVTADGTHAYTWYLFVQEVSTTLRGLDEVHIPAGAFFVNRSYQSVVLYEGESLVALPLGAGGPAEDILVTYVHVSPA